MFDDLLAPISNEAPSGEYLKDNRSLFRGYRNEFNMAQSSFRQLVEVPDALEDAELVDANTTNWNKLSESCHLCLATKSKDLEIFSWFTVAQLFTSEPFNNLNSALMSMEAVVENFWSTLHPMLPEKKRKGDTEQEQAVEIIEHRIKPLLQLVGDTAESGLLYMPLQMLPLIGDIDFGRFYKAEKDGSLSNLKGEAVIAYGHEKAEVEERIRALGGSLDALIRLETSLSEKCRDAGATPLSFKFVKDAIERLISSLRFLVGEQFSHWPLDPEPIAEVTQDVQVTALEQVESVAYSDSFEPVVGTSNVAQASLNIAPLPTGGVATREQALANLQSIADYFLEHEPHSPIYLLLKRAIRWGGMSLPELLEELVGDNSAVHQRIEHLAGLESAEHKATHSVAAVPQAVTPIEPVKEEVKPKETATTSESTTDPGLSNIEW
ncbi:ImpA family type VI secretion system protein [Vibrio maritimus]